MAEIAAAIRGDGRELPDGMAIASQNRLIAELYEGLLAARQRSRNKVMSARISELIDKIENWPQIRASLKTTTVRPNKTPAALGVGGSVASA